MAILLGANARAVEPIRGSGVRLDSWRAFRDSHNFIPAQWPVQQAVPGARVTLSLRPVPADLLAGVLDEPLRAFIAKAPAGAKLSAWHEASNLDGYPGYLTAGTMTRVHAHMQELCRHSQVRYGSIICAVPSQTMDWMGIGLDWYGLDIYDFAEGQFRNRNGSISARKLWARLDDMRHASQQVSGSQHPEIDICETNTPRVAYRADWFTLVADWLYRNGGSRLLSFWNPDGPLSGPWLPEDRKTVRAFQQISLRYGNGAAGGVSAGPAK
jgi:hypothetical protein